VKQRAKDLLAYFGVLAAMFAFAWWFRLRPLPVPPIPEAFPSRCVDGKTRTAEWQGFKFLYPADWVVETDDHSWEKQGIRAVEIGPKTDNVVISHMRPSINEDKSTSPADKAFVDAVWRGADPASISPTLHPELRGAVRSSIQKIKIGQRRGVLLLRREKAGLTDPRAYDMWVVVLEGEPSFSIGSGMLFHPHLMSKWQFPVRDPQMEKWRAKMECGFWTMLRSMEYKGP